MDLCASVLESVFNSQNMWSNDVTAKCWVELGLLSVSAQKYHIPEPLLGLCLQNAVG